MNQAQSILVRNGLVRIPTDNSGNQLIDEAGLATLMANLTHFGFALTEEGLGALNCLGAAAATTWWQEIRVILEKITGADKKMGEAVVYRNFPEEVLKMDEALYWGRQILMYWGFDKDLFREAPKDRPLNTERPKLKVLQLDGGNGLERIQLGLLKLPARWTDEQAEDARFLGPQFAHLMDLSLVSFKENMVVLAKDLIGKGVPFKSKSATDVLRLAVGLSGGDVSLRTKSDFMSFPRPHRRFLVGALQTATNLKEDLARDPGKWKKLMRALHPGDYAGQAKEVVAAYDNLYNGTLPQTFDGKVEAGLTKKDPEVLKLLQTRPGDFTRRLRVCIERFGMDAANAFIAVLPKLQIIQMLKIEAYLNTFNDRQRRMYAPKGNWSKVKLSDPAKDATVKPIPPEAILAITEGIGKEIRGRLETVVPSVNLDERTKLVRLQNNDSELTSYGRGTAFQVPEDAKFVRVSSYWEAPASSPIWYDNGVNFFTADWTPASTICWNSPQPFGKRGCAFSGDPVSNKDAKGRACQVIDLYLDQLRERGIRYAVWNVLCFSNQSFDQNKVWGSLQWGVEAKTGEIFDPARSQLHFEIKGANKTKYIAYLDLDTRQVVYLDANLPGQVNGANHNEKTLQEQMPAFLEVLATQPSIYDLFKHQKRDERAGVPILYDDAQTKIETGRAYVFKQVNKDNSFDQLNISDLLTK